MAEDRKKDVVYLYIFPRNFAKQVPNMSPYVIKLETWLRLHNVVYEIVETLDMKASPTKQIPFMYYNDVCLADSNLIIDFLTKELGFDPTEGLGPEQTGLARAILKMAEEELCHTYFTYRYVFHVDQWSRVFRLDPDAEKDARMKEMMRENMSVRIGARLNAKIESGDRKAEEDVAAIGKDDVRALSQILGEKDFFMGGDQPNKVDCSVFGILSQLYVDVPYPHKDVLEGEGANLTRFMTRIKNLAWEDWDTIVDKGLFE